MSQELCPQAIAAFAAKGILLGAVPKRDFAWSFTPYLKSEPSIKDLEIRIHKGDYMGPVVHRVTVPNVHYDDAHGVADAALADYKATLLL